jgi:hypothetical protein
MVAGDAPFHYSAKQRLLCGRPIKMSPLRQSQMTLLGEFPGVRVTARLMRDGKLVRLEDAFAWKEERRLSQALTMQHGKIIFMLESSELAKAPIAKYRNRFPTTPMAGFRSATVGRTRLPHLDKIRQVDQGAIADNKRLGPILAIIRDEQRRRGPERRNGSRRRDQRNGRLFKVS